jgi:hypothetical protein
MKNLPNLSALGDSAVRANEFSLPDREDIQRKSPRNAERREPVTGSPVEGQKNRMSAGMCREHVGSLVGAAPPNGAGSENSRTLSFALRALNKVRSNSSSPAPLCSRLPRFPSNMFAGTRLRPMRNQSALPVAGVPARHTPAAHAESDCAHSFAGVRLRIERSLR